MTTAAGCTVVLGWVLGAVGGTAFVAGSSHQGVGRVIVGMSAYVLGAASPLGLCVVQVGGVHVLLLTGLCGRY